ASSASGTIQGTTSTAPPTGGLDGRLSNTTCLAPDEPVANSSVSTTRFTTATFTRPVLMIQAPGDNSKWYVVEKPGTIRTIANDANATTSTLYFDLSAEVNEDDSELGLLGMAFDPDFQTNHRVCLSYTADPTGSGAYESRLARFVESGGTLTGKQIL